jgi:DNA-binding XRE family transcriptional regulator
VTGRAGTQTFEAEPVEQAGDRVPLLGAVGVLADRFAAALQEGRVLSRRMAPKGPILPREGTVQANLKNALGGGAFQAGLLVSVERNRNGLRQEDLAGVVGIDQTDISAIENGLARISISDAQIKKLLKAIGLPPNALVGKYLAWWRDNG